MTENGRIVLNKLSDAWNAFLLNYSMQENILPNNQDNIDDFRKCIHDAQRIIYTVEYLHEQETETQ